MDKPDLMSVLREWQVDYCVEKRAKDSGAMHYQVPINNRKELLFILVTMLKDSGRVKEFFTSNTKNQIVAELIPRGKRQNKDMIKGFRDATLTDLDWSVLEVYRAEDPNRKKYADLKKPKEEKAEDYSNEPKLVKKKHDPSKYKNEPDVAREPISDEWADLLGTKDKK